MKRRILALLLSLSLAVSLSSCGGGNGENSKEENPPTEPQQADIEEQSATPSAPEETGPTESISPEEFVQEVIEVIDGQVGEGESILGVDLDGNNLIITVELSGATLPDGLSLDILAETRTSSITDKILELEKYDDLWDTITVDFGDVGSVKCGKNDIEDSPYGRYFSSNSIKIQ